MVVQCVQPLPMSCTTATQEIITTLSQKQPATSPIASPVLVAKCKCHHRTLKEMPSPHSAMTIPDATSRLTSRSTDTGKYYYMSLGNLAISDFHQNTMERASVKSLRDDLLKCMFLKHAQNLKQGHLTGLPFFINCVRAQTIEWEVGKVVYVQICSEQADSKDTLVNIIAKLHQVFISNLCYKWLISPCAVCGSYCNRSVCVCMGGCVQGVCVEKRGMNIRKACVDIHAFGNSAPICPRL